MWFLLKGQQALSSSSTDDLNIFSMVATAEVMKWLYIIIGLISNEKCWKNWMQKDEQIIKFADLLYIIVW